MLWRFHWCKAHIFKPWIEYKALEFIYTSVFLQIQTTSRWHRGRDLSHAQWVVCFHANEAHVKRPTCGSNQGQTSTLTSIDSTPGESTLKLVGRWGVFQNLDLISNWSVQKSGHHWNITSNWFLWIKAEKIEPYIKGFLRPPALLAYGQPSLWGCPKCCHQYESEDSTSILKKKHCGWWFLGRWWLGGKRCLDEYSLPNWGR